MSEFAGARNSQSNVTDVMPVSNKVGITVGIAETLIVNPDPVNYRRVVLHNELGTQSFRIRIGDYLPRVFLDGNVSVSAMVAATPITFDDALDTATRTTGSWIDDGFVDGMLISVSGSAATLIGGPGIIIDDTGNTYTRDAGSFLDEGFVAGIDFTVGGSASNNGSDTIVSVTDTVITVAAITIAEATQTDLTMVSDLDNDGTMTVVGDPTALVLQLTAADVTITLGEQTDVTVTGVADSITVTAHGYDNGDGPYKLSLAGAALAGSPGVIIAADDTLTRDAGSWLDEGFVVGQTVTLGGSASNNGALTILLVTDLVITTTEDITVAEGTQTDLTLTAAGEALPTGLDATTNYYIHAVDDNNLTFHTSAAGAKEVTGSTANVTSRVDITAVSAGGVHTIGGMANHGLSTEPPTAPNADGYNSWKFDDAAPRTFSAPKSMTVVGSDATSVLACWWTP